MSDESITGDDYRPISKRPSRFASCKPCKAVASAVLWAWKNRPSFLKSFDEARRQTVNIFILLVGLLLGVVVVKATFFERTPVIDPIAIPKSLEEVGYSGTIVAQRLIDGAYYIGEESRTSKERVRYGSDSMLASLSAIQLPSSDLTVRSLVSALRDLLGLDGGRIGGEITIRRPGNALIPPRYALVLRIDRPPYRIATTFEADDIDELIKVSSQAIVAEFDPYVLASYYYSNDSWAQLDEVLDRLVASHDKKTVKWALNLRGLALKDRKETDEAIRVFENATTIDGDFAPALANWASMLVDKEDFDGAERLFRRAVRANADYPGGYNGWGFMLARMGDLDGAVDKYKQAIAVDPKYSSGYFNWGILLHNLGDLNGALGKFQMAVAVDPRWPYGHYGWGYILLKKKSYDASAERFQRAIQLGPRKALFQRGLGKLMLLKKDIPAAFECFQKAIELDDTDASVHVEWGDALAELKDYAEAARKYQRAMILLSMPSEDLSKKAQKMALYRDAGTVP